jgi:heme/copper-type cytochrome/quinol oxidase subunit 3
MSEGALPRSVEATTARAAARVAQGRLSLPNGWWGMLVFVASESTLFGCLFGSYFYLRFQTVHWPPPGIEPKDPLVPLILVGVLAATSVPMQLASLAGMRGRARVAWTALLLALVVQAGYFAFEIHDFRADLEKFTPQENAYASIYYTLLGADHAHVAVGLLLNLWLVMRLLGGLTNYRLIALRAITLYWHAVNVLTLFVIGTILSPSV